MSDSITEIFYPGGGYQEKQLRKFIRKVTLNGHMLPGKYESSSVEMFAPKPEIVFRVKKLLNYDEITGKAYVTEKRTGKAFWYFFAYLRLCAGIYIKFYDVRRRYKEQFPYMCTEEFWKSYLK